MCVFPSRTSFGMRMKTKFCGKKIWFSM